METHSKNRRVGVCGALRYLDGPFLFTDRFWKNPITEQTVGSLHLLADRAHRTDKKIILVLDNGFSDTSKPSKEAMYRLHEWIQVF